MISVNDVSEHLLTMSPVCTGSVALQHAAAGRPIGLSCVSASPLFCA